jgi:NAD(P)-dependent dehydrogenase (short-subunit alcohol dehydrogenase family)
MGTTGDWSLAGKTCVVTGATAGIGEVTARELARAGGRVVIVGRDPARCEATATRIRQATGRPVESLVANLADQAQVRRLADAIRERCDRIDVLVNNAGALFDDRRLSPDGIELTWALNHLAYVLLTDLLQDRIRASAPARIVNVASEAHRGGRIDFDDLDGQRRRYRAFRAYCDSKLANVLFTAELACRLEGSGVTANCLHPGFVASSFFNGPGAMRFVVRNLLRPLAISPERGAATSVHLASDPALASTTGRYFVKQRAVEPAPAARDVEAAGRLWAESRRQCGLAPA